MPENEQAGPVPRGQASPDDSPLESPLAAWSDELTNRIVNVVDWLKQRATMRLTTFLKALVYGSVALVALCGALFFLLVAVVRLWDVYVPIDPVGRRVWLAYVVVGGALCLAGAWLWSKRRESKS
jgi:hypothetical protein